MSKTRKIKKALYKLESKGGPKKIAKFLKKKGYKGWKEEPEHCPVSLYLTHKVGDTVYVTPGYARPAAGKRTPFDLVTVPSRVSAFIDRFDDGRYPKLIDTDTEADLSK